MGNIKQHYNSFLSTFINNFCKSYTLDDNAIHDMRVSIKHLRAYVRLLGPLANHATNQPLLLFYKKIFKPAGQLREIQVNYSLCKKENAKILYPYTIFLKKRLRKKSLDYQLVIEKTSLDALKKAQETINDLIKICPDVLFYRAATGYIKVNQKRIKKLLHQKSFKAEDLHTIRKLLKENKTYSQLQAHIIPSKKTKKLLKSIKKQEEAIGDWHDWDILCQNILYFIQKRKTPSKKLLKWLKAQKGKTDFLQKDIQKELIKYHT